MKIVNILLSVLVLLLAAVSAVSSYFLYEKRSLLVSGWDNMAKTINETSKILDNGSGTNIAKSLSPDTLAHENYAELNTNLGKFTSQAKKIQTQRDDLGGTIAQISDILSINNAPSKSDLNNLSNYQSSKSDAVRGVTIVKDRNDGTATRISSIAGKLGTSVSANALKSDSYKSELSKLSSRADFIKRRTNTFNSSIKKIASKSGAGSVNLSDSSYTNSLTKTVNSVNKLKLDYDVANRNLRQTKGQLAAMDKNSSNKDKTIAKRDKTIQDLKKTLIALNPSSGGKDAPLITPWSDGSKEALSAVKGQVIDVNRKYGFVVVSLGTSTLVEQKIGDKGLLRVNPKIQKDAAMVVARDINTDNGKFIGKIKLVKINENCSIANVVPDSLNGRRISVGDSVYFSNETIAKLSK